MSHDEKDERHNVEGMALISKIARTLTSEMAKEKGLCPACTHSMMVTELLGYMMFRFDEPITSEYSRDMIADILRSAEDFRQYLVKNRGEEGGPEIVVHETTEANMERMKKFLSLDEEESESYGHPIQ